MAQSTTSPEASSGHHDPRDLKAVVREFLKARGSFTVADVRAETGVTRQAVHYHLRPLIRYGEIEPVGRGPATRYRRPSSSSVEYSLSDLVEHKVWDQLVHSDERLQNLRPNALSIHRYAFTEMLNNAIDHSCGTKAVVTQWWADDVVSFEIEDDGIGAFRNVRQRFGLEDDFASIQEISKGKTTTDPERHTGQGLFFTSKAVDRFVLDANGLSWTVDNIAGDQAVGDSSIKAGTRVRWTLDSHTTRELKAVFDAYTDDELDFSRSRASITLFKTGNTFVSRSEAKRLAEGLDRFSEVLVDFAGVREVGQGFVDELFRVWARQYPGVRLTPVNMSPAVEAMVRRGLSGA